VASAEAGVNMERFKAKTRQFLKAHQNNKAVQKIRMNVPLSRQDLSELEILLIENGVGNAEEVNLQKNRMKVSEFFCDRSLGWIGKPQNKR
jgi:type I site-specific restriction endonuclease